jgi:hypothetical protein
MRCTVPKVYPEYTAVMENLIPIMDDGVLYNKQPDAMKTTLGDNTRLIPLQNLCVFHARALTFKNRASYI